MPLPEQPFWSQRSEDHSRDSDRQPLSAIALPPELAHFLQSREYGCVTHPTDRGTVLVIKAPGWDIESARGDVPVLLLHELYEHAAAPVIRLVTRIYDQPQRPLVLETFFNVRDDEQRTDYEALANQDRLYLLFYDEQIHHRLTKSIGAPGRNEVQDILGRAQAFAATIPDQRFDFDAAKAEVIHTTTL